jgi:hypothetical protein
MKGTRGKNLLRSKKKIKDLLISLPTTKQHFYIHREEERVKKVKGGVDWACT